MIMFCTCYSFWAKSVSTILITYIYIYVNIGILPPDVMYKIDALVIKFETASREPNILYANIMMHHYAFDYAVNRLVKHISQRNMSIALFLRTNHN